MTTVKVCNLNELSASCHQRQRRIVTQWSDRSLYVGNQQRWRNAYADGPFLQEGGCCCRILPCERLLPIVRWAPGPPAPRRVDGTVHLPAGVVAEELLVPHQTVKLACSRRARPVAKTAQFYKNVSVPSTELPRTPGKARVILPFLQSHRWVGSFFLRQLHLFCRRYTEVLWKSRMSPRARAPAKLRFSRYFTWPRFC